VLKNQHVPAKTVEEIEADPNLGMGQNRIRGSAITLPKIQDTLFTNQPSGVLEGKNLRKFDPDKPIKNVSKKPVNRKKFIEVPYALQPLK